MRAQGPRARDWVFEGAPRPAPKAAVFRGGGSGAGRIRSAGTASRARSRPGCVTRGLSDTGEMARAARPHRGGGRSRSGPPALSDLHKLTLHELSRMIAARECQRAGSDRRVDRPPGQHLEGTDAQGGQCFDGHTYDRNEHRIGEHRGCAQHRPCIEDTRWAGHGARHGLRRAGGGSADDPPPRGTEA